MLAGGEIGGVIGALVSVPILAVLRILWMRLCVAGDVDAIADTVASEGKDEVRA